MDPFHPVLLAYNNSECNQRTAVRILRRESGRQGFLESRDLRRFRYRLAHHHMFGTSWRVVKQKPIRSNQM